MTNKQVIIVTGADLAPEALALLRDYEIVFAGKTPQTADLVALAKAHNPVGIIVRYGSVTAEVMDAAPALKVISKHGTGTDTIDKAAAQARAIKVTAAAGANAAAVAEHALALMLACAKAVVQLDARMHAGHWDKATHKSVELNGLTIGLVGLGAIGRRFARMCDAIGMRVIGFDPFATDLPDYIEAVPLETIWEASDVISLQCPLTAENKEMVNASTLARCKRGVIIINTARGGLIEETALLEAVRSGRVSAAGLDSFAREPMSSPHIFQGQPGFVLSPHIGGVTSAAYVNMGVAAATNTIAVLDKVSEQAFGQQ
ncbi:NAD(P)-dependent oxidoreductase [Cupriavidus necator]|uniref:NAD(P)-dependent oxidoreductase n=1 Tax=Cupriavidus necator TaxID=106590 RepID=UPI0006902F71|nr:NAD(P)-dependent oxidoreductase [Cupriavidus necator]